MPGCRNFSPSMLPKKNSLFWTIGPEPQPPPFLKSNVPGLTVASFASVPTMLLSRNW